MLGTLILSLVAGFFFPQAEAVIRSVAERMTPNGIRMTAADFRVVSVATMLSLVAVILLFIGADSSLFVGAFGFALGVFALRIIAFIQNPDSVLGPSVWDREGEPADAPPPMPESQFDLDMETLRAVRSELDSNSKT